MLIIGANGENDIHLDSIRVISHKTERTGISIDDIIKELEGEKILLYQLESLTFGYSDTLLLPYLWNIVNLLKRQLGAEALIVHTGTKWQSANNVPEDITNQASKVRKAIFSSYREVVNSGTENISSDEIVNAALVDFFREELERCGDYRRSVRRVSKNSPFGIGYTLWEIAANKAIVDYATKNDFKPVKISLANQAVDFIVSRNLEPLDVYVIRFQLPIQSFGKGVVPYSVPSTIHGNLNGYYLLDDSLDTLIAKVKRAPVDDLSLTIRLLLHLNGNKHYLDLNEESLLKEASAIGALFLRAAQNAGGYPLKNFIPAIEVGGFRHG
ncbi:hypothetical protein HYX02_04345 [Candidatus Woesearchaeota archaeon]|nr:hypothetical protein [Candidatus Woesearchaeota archaeon]